MLNQVNRIMADTMFDLPLGAPVLQPAAPGESALLEQHRGKDPDQTTATAAAASRQRGALLSCAVRRGETRTAHVQRPAEERRSGPWSCPSAS